MTDTLVKLENLSDSALKAEIDLKAAPEKVYAAWTQPDKLVKWFCPSKGGHLHVDQFDCKVGGQYDVSMVFPDGDRIRIAGAFQELASPSRIVLTWRWTEGSAMTADTLVTVNLTPSQSGTHLKLTHERFVTVEARNDHSGGWDMVLSQLAAQFSG